MERVVQVDIGHSEMERKCRQTYFIKIVQCHESFRTKTKTICLHLFEKGCPKVIRTSLQNAEK